MIDAQTQADRLRRWRTQRALVALACLGGVLLAHAGTPTGRGQSPDAHAARSSAPSNSHSTPWSPPGTPSLAPTPDAALTPPKSATLPWGGKRLASMTPRDAAKSPMQPLPASNAAPLVSQSPVGLEAASASTPLSPAVQMASLATTTLPRADESLAPTTGQLPPGAREGVFQKATFSALWMPALSHDADALGITELDTGVVLGFPFMRRDTPLLITPQLNLHFLDNTTVLDLPNSLYGAATEFRHLRKFGDGPWAMDVAATVGYYSDFETSSDEAVRVSGRGLAVYESSPATKWLVGVAYLNRAGATVLPVAGVIHEPSSDTRWELIFPRPRLAWRTRESHPSDERWIYLGAEFGGGVWAITRPSSDEEDLLQYSDYRLMGGYERKLRGGLSRRYEFGYVFNRELEFNVAPSVKLDDSFFARLGIAY